MSETLLPNQKKSTEFVQIDQFSALCLISVYVDTSALVGGLLAVLIILAAVGAFILWNKGNPCYDWALILKITMCQT